MNTGVASGVNATYVESTGINLNEKNFIRNESWPNTF